jgi:hypothetical protein
MISFKVIECDQIETLIKNMHKILFSGKPLTYDDRRDLQNLLAIVEERLREESHTMTMDDYK